MAQRPSFDLSKMSAADRLIAGGAGLYFIWSFIPVWYKLDIPEVFGVPGASINGWHGITTLAAILSILALAWVGMRIAGVNLNLNVKPGLIDLALAGVALLLTLLGLVANPAFYGISWGIFVAIVLALIWTYGAYMKFNEPAGTGGLSS